MLSILAGLLKKKRAALNLKATAKAAVHIQFQEHNVRSPQPTVAKVAV